VVCDDGIPTKYIQSTGLLLVIGNIYRSQRNENLLVITRTIRDSSLKDCVITTKRGGEEQNRRRILRNWLIEEREGTSLLLLFDRFRSLRSSSTLLGRSGLGTRSRRSSDKGSREEFSLARRDSLDNVLTLKLRDERLDLILVGLATSSLNNLDDLLDRWTLSTCEIGQEISAHVLEAHSFCSYRSTKNFSFFVF
jgi:hypothetical protein